MTKKQINTDESLRFVAQHYKKNAFDPRKGWKNFTAIYPQFRKTQRVAIVFQVAAVALVFIIAGVAIYLTKTQNEHYTAHDRNLSLTLQDQTGVLLHKDATLTYDYKYGRQKREVYLLGEADFIVTPNADKPFIVSTPVAQITVLGTTFNVNTNKTETSLFVESGKVEFTPNNPIIPLICEKGMRLHYMAPEQYIEVTTKDSEMKIDGKNNVISFQNVKLKDLGIVISHYYNVSIEIPEKEQDMAITSSFKQKNVTEIISLINFTLNTHLTIK